jgi:hypothetical protein
MHGKDVGSYSNLHAYGNALEFHLLGSLLEWCTILVPLSNVCTLHEVQCDQGLLQGSLQLSCVGGWWCIAWKTAELTAEG